MAGRDSLAFTLTATQMASGNMKLTFFTSLDGLNSSGQAKYEAVISAAQVTAIAALTSGQTSTVTYAENTGQGDYTANVTASV